MQHAPVATGHSSSAVFRSLLAVTLRSIRLLSWVSVMTVTSLAQVDTGAIVGKVMDLSGAAIPNAKVTAHEQATGIDITVVTGIDGNICTTIISTPKTSLFRMGNASRSSA